MIARKLEAEVLKQIKLLPCVAILGPRQTGKTTLAKKIAATLKNKTIYLDVEKPSDRLKLSDAETYLAFHNDKCVIIDEIQFMPELFAILRPLIDDKRKPGRFIITGSASPELVKGVSESLAGRIAYTELTPIGFTELPKAISLQRHWFRGGFPDALTGKTEAISKNWLDNFIKSFIERDLNRLYDINLPSALVRNFWQMLAYNDGGILNSENYARALSVSAPTVQRYLDFLEGAYIIRRLQPWFANINKRLVKAPKVYIRDAGLLHRLANIEDMDNLRGNSLIGASWEGYVIEQIAQALPQSIRMFFYRTHNGAEIDVVLVARNKVCAAIEIKLKQNATPSKGFYESIKTLEAPLAYIVSPYGETYPLDKSIFHCSISSLINIEIPKIATMKIKY